MRISTGYLTALLLAFLEIALIAPALSATAPSELRKPGAPDAGDDLEKIAADCLALTRTNAPRDVLPSSGAAALATQRDSQDRLLERLHALDPSRLTGPSATAYAILTENLASLQAVRVCRSELWDINHITGWQISLPPQAAAQSVTTAAERERALRRWSSLPTFIDTDIANLRAGLTSGEPASSDRRSVPA
jgi:uncharacterized protein (DUF885 family)